MKNRLYAAMAVLAMGLARPSTVLSAEVCKHEDVRAFAAPSVFRLGSGGTGYVVDPPAGPRGHLLMTNEHVVRRARRLEENNRSRFMDACVTADCRPAVPMAEFDDDCGSSPDRFGLLAEVVLDSKARDLALVRVLDDREYPALALSKDVTGKRADAKFVGRKVAVLGFWKSHSGDVTSGRVTSVTKKLADLSDGHKAMSPIVPIWFHDGPICGGSSGAPVFRDCTPEVLGTMFGGHGAQCSEGRAYFMSAHETAAFLAEAAGAIAALESRIAEKGGIAAYVADVKVRMARRAELAYVEAYVEDQKKRLGRTFKDAEDAAKAARDACPKKNAPKPK